MTLPGDRIPEEALPPERGSSTPAEDATLLPVYCRHGITWSWVGDQGGYVCDDPQHYMGPPAAQSGAIPPEHQPHYAHPPNAAQLQALRVEDAQTQADTILRRARDITGW